MFIARTKSGEIINLLEQNEERISQLKVTGPFFCPSCREEVDLKISSNKAQFFHRKPCRKKAEGESLEHFSGKFLLYHWLISNGFQVELEKYLPKTRQRPDLFCKWRGKHLAIEFQCSVISPEEIRKRSRSYTKMKINFLWVLHDKLLVNHTNQEIEFGDFLSCFLRASFTTHPQILALDPMEGRLFRYINFLPVSKGKAVAEKKLLTIKTSIDEVFSPQQISNRLYMNWFYAIEKWLYFLPLGREARKNPFLKYLYAHGLHPLELPPEVGVMVPDMDLIKTPPLEWQAYLYLHFFYGKEKGDVFSDKEMEYFIFSKLKHIVKWRDGFPFTLKKRPIFHYLQLLEEFSILKKKQGHYIIEKPLSPIEHPNRSRAQLRQHFFQKNKPIILKHFG